MPCDQMCIPLRIFKKRYAYMYGVCCILLALLTRAHTASEATLGQNTSTANWVRPPGASNGRLGLVVWLFSKEKIAVYPPQTSILKVLRRSCHEQRNRGRMPQ
jgi:hypothetical protein